MNKGLILLFVAAVVIIAVGFVYYKYFNKQIGQNVPVNVRQMSQKAQPASLIVDTSAPVPPGPRVFVVINDDFPTEYNGVVSLSPGDVFAVSAKSLDVYGANFVPSLTGVCKGTAVAGGQYHCYVSYGPIGRGDHE